ncbi:minichromosome maintenance domain-containing protein 2 isoform X2 [Halyomorpha halys]|uniref:minichromosome maintenance domain-containing protein 2 isoform X2 n=1 Tax=Halyomorpha halys TaxID=286706 RepID=UPI0006D50E90|nr:uncharacterized protein LOC106684292 isoform X2 [Halyomorpha halys]
MHNMKINLVKFLDKTGDLRNIEESAFRQKSEIINANLNNTFFPPLRISLGFDYITLLEIAGEFASLLVEEPNIAKKEVTDLVKTCCAVLTELEDITVHLLFRLTSFPDLVSVIKSENINPGGLFTKTGILAKTTPVEKYTQDISFTCKYTTCLKKGKILKKNGKCSDCGKELIEIARSRLSGEKVYGLFLNPNFLQPSKEYTRTQCIMVELRDELFTSLEIGIRYNLALTIEKDKYVAWGVQPMLPDPLVRAISNLAPPPFPSKISQFISTIKENTYDSPWALVTAFSSIIPGDSYPLSAFLHLKTALLLSLGSICSKSPVPILALGDCGKLMMDAWYCSPRAIFSPSSSTSLLLASYGVCLVHDNITALSFVTTAVESELVTVTNHVLPKDKSHSTYSLKAAVWMYWNCNKHSGQDVNKLKTLIKTSLSESHARLSLRDTVTYEDAVAAIYLYEESISILFGPSVSSELPKRTVTANSPVEIARQMDTILGKFSLWLQSYTTNQNNSIPEDNDGSFQFLSTSSMNSSVNDFSTL